MIVKIISPLILFFLGYFLKKLGLFGKDAGDTMLKLVFYVAQPAAILSSVSFINFDSSLLILPFLPAVVSTAILGIAFLIGRKLSMNSKKLGTFLVGTAIMNTGFSLPFVIAVYGNEGLARMVLIDVGNAFFVFSVVYILAAFYGDNNVSKSFIAKKLLISPPLWALVLALIINIFNLTIPTVLMSTVQTISYMIVPLIMIALGIYFSPKIFGLTHEFLAVFIRMGLGLLLGLAIVNIFNIAGMTAAVILIALASPIGYNTLTFSSLEKLDDEFAASMISVSIVCGILLIPVLMAVYGA